MLTCFSTSCSEGYIVLILVHFYSIQAHVLHTVFRCSQWPFRIIFTFSHSLSGLKCTRLLKALEWCINNFNANDDFFRMARQLRVNCLGCAQG